MDSLPVRSAASQGKTISFQQTTGGAVPAAQYFNRLGTGRLNKGMKPRLIIGVGSNE